MKSLAVLCLAVLSLSAPAAAQGNCSTLVVSTELDPVRPRQTVSLDVTGSIPGAPVYAIVGTKMGQTTIDLRALGMLVLDLEAPFKTDLIGIADANGDLSRSLAVPAGLGLSLYTQTVGVKIAASPGDRPKLAFCTSNVVSVVL